MVVAEKDVKDASRGVLDDLKRFQGEKEDDLRRYMVRISLVRLLLSHSIPVYMFVTYFR